MRRGADSRVLSERGQTYLLDSFLAWTSAQPRSPLRMTLLPSSTRTPEMTAPKVFFSVRRSTMSILMSKVAASLWALSGGAHWTVY